MPTQPCQPRHHRVNLCSRLSGMLLVTILAAGCIFPIPATNADRFEAYAGIPFDDSIDSDRAIGAASDVSDGVVRGVLHDGTPFIGSMDAPIVIAMFTDFACIHCVHYEAEADQLIQQFVRSGQLRLEVRLMIFVAREYSVASARSALCAAEQGVFWEYKKDLLMLFETEGEEYFTVPNLEALAVDLGLNVREWQSCMYSTRPDRTLRSAENLRADYGINAVPSLIYRANGAKIWNRFFDANGEPASRVGYVELGELIERFNSVP